MENIIKVLQSVLPFLSEYPPWVRTAAVVWILLTAAMIAVLVLAPRLSQIKPSEPPAGHIQTGQGNILAGRDVTVINQGAIRREALLEVTQIRFTPDGEFDVLVRNLGDSDLVIHKITIKKLEEPGIGVAPVLSPTAKYHIPVGDIPIGGSKSLDVSHVVPANGVDRFLIALETTMVLTLEVTLYYNRDGKVTFTQRIW